MTPVPAPVSSQMLNRYRRTASTVAELDMGALSPMVEAIPELAMIAAFEDMLRALAEAQWERREAEAEMVSRDHLSSDRTAKVVEKTWRS